MSCGEEKCVSSCEPVAHTKHMCLLMREEFHLNYPAEFKELVQNAEYRCNNCGRTVKNSANVCAPVSL